MKGKIFEKFKLNIFTKKSALLFLLVFTFLLFLPNIAFAS